MSSNTFKAYRGNTNLLGSGVKIQWSKEMLEDFKKCVADPVYFAEKHFKIVHVDDGLIPLKLYDFQREIISDSVKHRNQIAITGRQQGKTTTATAVILHHCLFNKHRRVALIANKEATAIEILSRIKLAFLNLPNHIKGGIAKWGERSVEFENGSTIIASASSGDNVRGKTCVTGSTKITVRNKHTGEIKEICMSDLEHLLINSGSSKYINRQDTLTVIISDEQT